MSKPKNLSAQAKRAAEQWSIVKTKLNGFHVYRFPGETESYGASWKDRQMMDVFVEAPDMNALLHKCMDAVANQTVQEALNPYAVGNQAANAMTLQLVYIRAYLPEFSYANIGDTHYVARWRTSPSSFASHTAPTLVELINHCCKEADKEAKRLKDSATKIWTYPEKPPVYIPSLEYTAPPQTEPPPPPEEPPPPPEKPSDKYKRKLIL